MSFKGTDNVQGHIYEHIFAQTRGFCDYDSLNILQRTWKNVKQQLTFNGVGCFHLSVLWCSFMKIQLFPFFCNNHKTLSHLELNFQRRLLVMDSKV